MNERFTPKSDWLRISPYTNSITLKSNVKVIWRKEISSTEEAPDS